MIAISGQRKKISDVGEFGLITGISNLIRASKNNKSAVILGPGDDAALFTTRPGHTATITSDILIEGIHFRHDWSQAESIGIKSMAVNISDIASMGGRPRVAVISLGLKGDESDRWVFEFYRGALRVADQNKCAIVGGDIVASPRATVVSVTIYGEISPRKPPLLRDQARAGDVIAVTGPLGLSAAGARILSDDNLKLEGSPRMLDAHRRPEARMVQGLLLRWAGVRCAMDLSDGLLGDLPKICDASEVQALLYEEKIPVPNSVRWGFSDWFELAMRGGEDFELLFTCPQENFVLVEMLFKRWGCPPPIQIGEILEPRESRAQIQMTRSDRRKMDLDAGAWDHFTAIR
ncbi:MAG: thiamine-phosphate kinase [Thermomicrobiales bacterium]